MTGRVLKWGGGLIAVAALVALGAYFVAVGLDKADKLASVIGVFVAVVGLAVSVYGMAADRRAAGGGQATGGGQAAGQATASGERSIAIGGDNTGIASTGDGAINVRQQATASGNGRIYQSGRDMTINDK
ncbi:hypothetical protein [Actinoallomurus sp. CA-150999]|uniref:hypothetical protein n=1 Tax=Actinoallomurus sp. CA-150999 TaxID=3239887 RepID=UPI003D8FD2DE